MPVDAVATGALSDPVGTVEAMLPLPPELVAGVVIGLVVLLVLAYVLIRRFRRGKEDILLSKLASYDELAILMHPNPDPDAMGSAIGLANLAESQGTETRIYYPGQIRHQENRAFRTVLDLELERIEGVADIRQRNIALVDHNEPRGFVGAEGIDPDIVIDHHPGDGTGSVFTDVRPSYGACASIITEYFEKLGADRLGTTDNVNLTDGGTVEHDGRPCLSESTATGLLYGIQSDTKRLTNGCTDAEFAASAFLFPGANEDLLDRIANPQVSSEMLETKATAIRNRVLNGPFAISDVGDVDDVDAIPQAAEELIRLEGTSAVVVYGSKDGVVHLSGRSRDDRLHMGRIMEDVLDDVAMASGGGHARMGGGQVPLEYLAGIGPSAVSEDRARADLRGKLFNAMRGNT